MGYARRDKTPGMVQDGVCDLVLCKLGYTPALVQLCACRARRGGVDGSRMQEEPIHVRESRETRGAIIAAVVEEVLCGLLVWTTQTMARVQC